MTVVDRRRGACVEPIAGPGRRSHWASCSADAPDRLPDRRGFPAFWLYTSGTTGTPKGAMHRHGSVRVVCETYGTQVLGITAADRCLSAAKAFFAYGLETRAVPAVGRRDSDTEAARLVPT